jgi:hypothetical protein
MPNPTLPATVFKSPAIALSGVVDYDMYTKFRTQFDKASDQDIVVIELSTLGGDPEVARMMGEDVRFASEMEPARRFVFFGKAAIYSAGVTFMSFFAKGTHLKVTGGKQPATCYLMNAAGLFCFNQLRAGYVAGFGTMRPRCISWVTALAGCLGSELTFIGPLQSSTGYWPARRLAFPMASPSSAQIIGSYPTKFPSGPTM